MTTTSIFNALSMADSRLHSIFSSRSLSPSLSIPSRPIKLHSLSLFNKTHFTSLVARAEEDGTVALEQEQEVVAQGSFDDSEGQGSFDDSQGDSVPGPSEDAKLFVANIPYDVDGERLAALFEDVGVVEIAEVIYNRDTDRSRGFGFVTMSNVEDAEKAVEKFNGYELDGRPLVVNKAGVRGERVDRPPRTFSPGFRIYVGNLPWDVDNSRLEQMFSEHGKVSEARVVLDRETGRSRGFGFVLMADETGMNDAIAALDGQSIDGRTIRVSVAQERTRRF